MRVGVLELHRAILREAADHPKDLSPAIMKRFGLSRQTVSRHISALIHEGLLEASGNTRARTYAPKQTVYEFMRFDIAGLQEDLVWRERVLPLLTSVPDNVLSICNYGFTEMLNNVISHSEADYVLIEVERTGVRISITIRDFGVGIFDKIKREMGLNDPRHALLELSKGKLTTDRSAHTGEGIFFTSRMFDEFTILSRTLFYLRKRIDRFEWLIEALDEVGGPGTSIRIQIFETSVTTAQEVFDQYASGTDDDFSFSRTHVPVKLAKYENDELISRSAARRVLARFDRFKEVLLDFQDVESIGQAFADEIFRVFKAEHPEVVVTEMFTNHEVQQMIGRARASGQTSA